MIDQMAIARRLTTAGVEEMTTALIQSHNAEKLVMLIHQLVRNFLIVCFLDSFSVLPVFILFASIKVSSIEKIVHFNVCENYNNKKLFYNLYLT